jgi:hypothetical protein
MIIIYTFLNDEGIGDNLRGLIFLLQLQKRLQVQKRIKNIKIFVDFSKCKIHKYLSHTIPLELQKLSENIEIKKFTYGDENLYHSDIINYILQSKTNIILINTNNYPDVNDITKNMKNYIKSIFKFNPYFEDILNSYYNKLSENFSIYHYRFGDEVFNDDINDFEEIINSFKQKDNDKEKCLVLSDSFNLKKKLYHVYNNNNIHVFLNKPTHTNNTNDEDDINIYLDFFLITKATTIYCCSNYRWVSNFVLWNSYIYDIPLINLKNR